MNHLFYLHSNITCLSSYEMIFNLQKRGEEVTIILSRNLKWPFSLKVNRIVNISRMNFFLHTKVDKIRSLRSYILALYCKKRMKNYINSIVGEDDYIAYIPNYKSMIISNLCERKQCKGYYYIEEGTLSYFSIDYAKKVMHYSNFFKLLSVVLMVNYDFALKQTKKFKGTISINESAFPWNKRKSQTGTRCAAGERGRRRESAGTERGLADLSRRKSAPSARGARRAQREHRSEAGRVPRRCRRERQRKEHAPAHDRGT